MHKTYLPLHHQLLFFEQAFIRHLMSQLHLILCQGLKIHKHKGKKSHTSHLQLYIFFLFFSICFYLNFCVPLNNSFCFGVIITHPSTPPPRPLLSERRWSTVLVKVPMNSWPQRLHVNLFGGSLLIKFHAFASDFGVAIIYSS